MGGRAPQLITGVPQSWPYKGVLLDQFGVLHNGREPYPAAIQAVQAWASAGVQVYVLSNSSRRASEALHKIGSLGFKPEWFSGVMTSGEVTYRSLADRPTAAWRALGKRCLHVTWASGQAIDLDGLDVQPTTDPSEAEFILAHGTEAITDTSGELRLQSVDELKALLESCAAAGAPPLVLANPDFVTVAGEGQLAIMPGTLAQHYADHGGPVWTMGKPAKIIYDVALDELGLRPEDVVCVGDSMHHDIKGAADAGLDSLFVAGGIHAEELCDADGTLALTDEATAKFFCRHVGLGTPTYMIDFLSWE